MGFCSNELKKAGKHAEYLLCPNDENECGSGFYYVFGGPRTNIQTTSVPANQACVIGTMSRAQGDEKFYKLVESEMKDVEVSMFYGAVDQYTRAGDLKSTYKTSHTFTDLPGQFIKVEPMQMLTFVAVPKKKDTVGGFKVGIFLVEEDKSGSGGLGGGAIFGIIVAVLVGVGAIGGGIFYFIRRKRASDSYTAVG
eukprot:CAMPEP_0196999886 /NCGR_PEP_ID=MMETSP1380-20130617/4969_1 /TAXON_ID=5936 /ORGANISM="Euplotes crassus, Strain CT5" /LENGTH=194 /DNA_ID=CAMNT_0042416981 /DNA_START=235 /DNA_END=819 /DNA_ORIENTATION=+